MVVDIDYKTAIKKHKALADLGINNIYLSGDDYPWDLVVDCEFGTVVRLGTPVQVDFIAHDLLTDLTFRWHSNLEYDTAQGASFFQFNSEKFEYILSVLNGKAKLKFKKIVTEYSERIAEQANEIQSLANNQFKLSAFLMRLVE